jgi:hypothetical protein
MRWLVVSMVGLVLLSGVVSAAPSKRAAVKGSMRWHAVNAVLPPRSLRDPADMKHPALAAVGWQVSKVLSPITTAGINVVVRDFELSRNRGGASVLTPASIAVTNGLVFSLVAAVVAKEVGRPVARQLVRIAGSMPPTVKSAAAKLTEAADTLVIRTDRVVRRLAR